MNYAYKIKTFPSYLWGWHVVFFLLTIDRHSMHSGDAWKLKLRALIVEADTVVFLLSPDRAMSEMCVGGSTSISTAKRPTATLRDEL